MDMRFCALKKVLLIYIDARPISSTKKVILSSIYFINIIINYVLLRLWIPMFDLLDL